jgi:hypothetical protein
LRDSYLHICCIYKSSLCITKFALRVNLERLPHWARLRLCCYSVFKDRAQALQTTEGPAVRMPRRAGKSNTTELLSQCFSLFFFAFDKLDVECCPFMAAPSFVFLKVRGKLLD